MPDPIDVIVKGTGPGASVSVSGRSDDPIRLQVQGEGRNQAIGLCGPDDQFMHLKLHGGEQIRANATVNAAGEIATHVDVGNSDNRPFAAAVGLQVGGDDRPIKLSPLAFDLGRQRLSPNLTITFKLFGITIGSIQIGGTTDLAPLP